MEVTLEQMLLARENRVLTQTRLREETGLPLISFTMNIPGPVKCSPLIERGFREGGRLLREALDQRGLTVVKAEESTAVTGCQGCYAVTGDPEELKTLCAAIENASELGRLFDLDVLDTDGIQLRRGALGQPERGCMVCGAPGRGCASRRVHSVETLQQAVRKILADYFCPRDAREIGRCALRGLLDEVCATPKPGLVDRENNGSHADMDIFTFTASAAALAPYFTDCAVIGQNTRSLPPEETFRVLRKAGRDAEAAMFAATGGINTHKGAVFTLGILCGAMGRLWRPEGGPRDPAEILRECARMTGETLQQELAESLTRPPRTAGERLYAEFGLAGIRGEMAAGLPSVGNIALPALHQYRHLGRNTSAVLTLLTLIARVADTNMVSRGGPEKAREAAEKTARLLEEGPTPEKIRDLDRWFVSRRLSPGGCADLLAAALCLHDWCGEP